MNLKRVGKDLKRLRKEAGITPAALAYAAGISEVTYRKIENGVERAPDPITLAILAGSLGVTAAQLGEEAPAAAGPTFPRMFRSLDEVRAFLDGLGAESEVAG